MRQYQIIGGPLKGQEAPWIINQLHQISSCSQQEAAAVADAYTIANPPPTPVRTLDLNTATLADLLAVVATIIRDLQLRGTNVKGQ